ncbi:MAG TPA: hypothetical protein EYP31_09325 [Roseibacterium sp.]|nr:hypothetical protein [Roseibacterium sp.]
MAPASSGISVSFWRLAFVFPAREARTRIASWLAGRDSHGLLMVLFALFGWGTCGVSHILWAGFMGITLATGLMLLYGFDGGAGPFAFGPFAFGACAALITGLGTSIWRAVSGAGD